MELSSLPPSLQVWVTLIAGVIVAGLAIWRGILSFKRPEEMVVASQQFRMLGAALGDSMALNQIADEVRSLRTFMEHRATLRDQLRLVEGGPHDKLANAVEVLTAELRRGRLGR